LREILLDFIGRGLGTAIPLSVGERGNSVWGVALRAATNTNTLLKRNFGNNGAIEVKNCGLLRETCFTCDTARR
jgi:hypothetical protein